MGTADPTGPGPAHGSRARVAAHDPPHGRRASLRRAGQLGSVLMVGGLTLALALHGSGGSRPEAGDGPAASGADLPAPETSSAAPTTPTPLLGPVPSGVVDPAEDRDSMPPAGRNPTVPPSVTLTPPAAAGLDLAAYSTSDPASPWVVVNKALPISPGGFAPTDLVAVAGYDVRAVVQEPLTRLLAAAAADGVAVQLRSGFRSHEYQAGVHADWAARVGQARSDEVSARAGYSEHQLGLAVDVGSGSRPACDFEDCFDQTPEGAWVAARATEFGFLLRYTAATQAVTGFAPEGWHLRYVGTDLIAEMQRRGVGTLEELFDLPGGAAYP